MLYFDERGTSRWTVTRWVTTGGAFGTGAGTLGAGRGGVAGAAVDCAPAGRAGRVADSASATARTR